MINYDFIKNFYCLLIVGIIFINVIHILFSSKDTGQLGAITSAILYLSSIYGSINLTKNRSKL